MRMIQAAMIAFSLLVPWSASSARHVTTYVMRHLDTLEGERDPDLTRNGQARAQQLVEWFRGKPLAAIYVTDFRRTRQTVAPLARRRGLVPKLYSPTGPAALLAEVRAERGPVLIVGHSNTVPDLVERLGGDRPAALSHPDFVDIWVVRVDTARDRVGK